MFHVKVSKKLLGLLILALLAGSLFLYFLKKQRAENPIRIGILYSESMITSFSKESFLAAASLAVQEINKKGGLLGRLLEIRSIDGDGKFFEQDLETWMAAENIHFLFGCLTTRCLSHVKPIIEQRQGLLFFLNAYEGFDQSSNVIYLGPVPNQQIIPGLRWALDHLGLNFYLVGAKNRESWVAHQMAFDLSKISSAKILGEELISEDITEAKNTKKIFSKSISEIKKLKPQFIFNTLKGEALELFVQSLAEEGMDDYPLLFTNLDEQVAYGLSHKYKIKNIYSLNDYFSGVPIESNRRFVANLKQTLGEEAFISAPMERVYTAINLWAETVKQKKTLDPLYVNTETLLRQSYPGPSGVVAVDAVNRHTWKFSMVLQWNKKGNFEILDRSLFPIKPSPWPVYRTREEWREIMKAKQKSQGIFN